MSGVGAMNTRLAGKVAIVTGAASGLGRACASLLAEQGARVVIADIAAEAAESTAANIRGRGHEALAVGVDVASEEQVRALIGRTIDQFGRIDVLHNNAAALDLDQRGRDRDVCNVEIEAWDRAMNVNARGAMLACKHAVPHMLRQGGGSIIFASSGFGYQGDLTLTSYAASKAALIILAKSVAAQYGKQGIRANAIQIGLVVAENAKKTMAPEVQQILLDAHLTPTLGTPRNVADVVAFLASDESAFITGTTLVVDGGFSSHAPSLAPLREYFAKLGSNRL